MNIIKNLPPDVRYNYKYNVCSYVLYGLFCGMFCNFWGYVCKNYFHATPFWIGLITVSGTLSGFMCMGVSAFIPKGQEHKYVGYIGIVSGIFLCVAPFIKGMEIFCILIFLFHFLGCFSGAENTVIGKIYSINIRTKVLGVANMYKNIANSIAILFAGEIINSVYFHVEMWKVLFFFAGIFSIVSRCCYMKMNVPNGQVEESQNPLKFVKEAFSLIIREKFNIPLIVSGIFFISAFTLFTTAYPIYQVDVLHITGKQVGYISFVTGIVSIIFFPIIGNWFGKISPIKAYYSLFLFAALNPLVYIFIGKSWVPLLAGAVFLALFTIVNDLANLNIIIWISGNKPLEYQSLYAFSNGIKAFIGLGVSTYVLNFLKFHCVSLKWTFVIGIALLGVGFLFAMIFRKMKTNTM